MRNSIIWKSLRIGANIYPDDVVAYQVFYHLIITWVLGQGNSVEAA